MFNTCYALQVRGGAAGPRDGGVLDSVPSRGRRGHREGVHAGAQRGATRLAHRATGNLYRDIATE